MCSGSEAGSYLRLKDSCITQPKAQGPSRTCNESKEEEEVLPAAVRARLPSSGDFYFIFILESGNENYCTIQSYQ